MGSIAKQRLMNEYKGLAKEKWVNIELAEGGLYKWSIGLMVVNDESLYNGAYFKTEMTFTDNYPMAPPKLKFVRPPNHPNIYPNGDVCMSILHPPGEDEQSGESAAERWNSALSVEVILRSVLLLLDHPEPNSPANVDAGKLFREQRANYEAKAIEAADISKKDIPKGFVMPTTVVEAPPPKPMEDDDFWAQSDEDDDDFGASDSSGEDMGEDGDEQEESEEDQDDELEE